MKTWIDPVTNLEWEAVENNLEINWIAAKDYAESLKDGWRLPILKELLTLVDYTKFKPAVIDGPNLSSYGYWTSTALTYDSDQVWGVDFSYGIVDKDSKTNYYYARCVRPMIQNDHNYKKKR